VLCGFNQYLNKKRMALRVYTGSLQRFREHPVESGLNALCFNIAVEMRKNPEETFLLNLKHNFVIEETRTVQKDDGRV